MNKPILLLLAVSALACNNPINPNSSSEDKSTKKVVELKYDKIHEMPGELDEISGITFLNDSVVAAIEDENGILYFYNIKQEKIERKIDFGKADDYEDVVLANNDIYIINSSGEIFQVKNFDSEKPVIKNFKTAFGKKNDIEGMAFESKKNRLLIGVKGNNLDKSEENKQVYAFDLNTMQLIPEAVYKIQLNEIESYFEGDAIEESSKKFLKALGNKNMSKVFNISALTVNSLSGEIFILSSLNNLIAVLSPDGSLKSIYKLDKDFKQPEGIAFSGDGKLYISNESGGKGSGNIIEMNYAN
ncbi:SdiA-regulated domain-containing protein [Daejeonella oryzae]|uniref:SdiA-regulated domain-containing protein n=1 Tax=Daejeonella oryzae TaxID=1122943 RepID=UPI00138ABCB3|nr:SdiA-regulated domain-containing protein [Daejeonella oryzae]